MTTVDSAERPAASTGLVVPASGVDPRFAFRIATPPVRFVGSIGSGWDGVFLGDGTAGPTGEAIHDHQTLAIQHWLTPNPCRPIGGPGGWKTLEPGVRVRFPGDAEHAEWRDGPRSRFLFVTPERVERVLGARWDLTGLTRWREPRYQLPLVEHVLAALIEDVEAGYPAGPLTGDALLCALLQHLNGPVPQPRSGALGRRRLEAVRAHIEANLARPMRLAELAALAGVGTRRFGALFVAETGWSPHQYVLHRRIERAKELMRDPELTLGQVACAVGFAHAAHFSRVFRRCTGEPPRVYRNR